MKHYTIIYFSRNGFFERFSTYANNKREARKNIKAHLRNYVERIEEINED